MAATVVAALALVLAWFVLVQQPAEAQIDFRQFDLDAPLPDAPPAEFSIYEGQAALVVYGHVHQAFVRRLSDGTIVVLDAGTGIRGLGLSLPATDRPLHIHSQGQPEDNRHWIICHDFPNERMTTEILATVPANLKVLSNGEWLEFMADGGMRLVDPEVLLAKVPADARRVGLVGAAVTDHPRLPVILRAWPRVHARTGDDALLQMAERLVEGTVGGRREGVARAIVTVHAVHLPLVGSRNLLLCKRAIAIVVFGDNSL